MILNLLICVTYWKVKYAFGAAFCTGVSRDRYLYLLKRRVVWLVVSINITISIWCMQWTKLSKQNNHRLMMINKPAPTIIGISECFMSRQHLRSYNQNIPTLSWDILLVYIEIVYLSFWPVLNLNWPLFYPVPSSRNKTIWSQSEVFRILPFQVYR